MKARITKITKDRAGLTTVKFVWLNLDGCTVADFASFDLTKLGKVITSGEDLYCSWVVLEGECLLTEGDII